MTTDVNNLNDATGPESYRLGLDAALKEAIRAFVDVRFVPEDDAEPDALQAYAAPAAEVAPEADMGQSAPLFARRMLSVPAPDVEKLQRSDAMSYEDAEPLYGAASASEAIAPEPRAAAPMPQREPTRKRRRAHGGVIESIGHAIGGVTGRGKHAKATTEAPAYAPAEERADEEPCLEEVGVFGNAQGIGLKEWLDEVDAPFSTTLLRLIDERGYDDVDVYKRAGMSRQLFSRIRSDAEYRPAKKTVLALAVALRLNVDDARDLLERAGFALSHSDKRDLVVEYFLENGTYDLMAVNQALYEFDQPLL